MNTIEDLKQLEKDWDGFNGLPISRIALEKAEELLSSGVSLFKEKYLFPNNSGTVIFENADVTVEITETKYEVLLFKNEIEIEGTFSHNQKNRMLSFITKNLRAVS